MWPSSRLPGERSERRDKKGLSVLGAKARRLGHSHGHDHSHDFSNLDYGQSDTERNSVIHGPELRQIPFEDAELLLSIYEFNQLPRFRITVNGAAAFDSVNVETHRPDGQRETSAHRHWHDHSEASSHPVSAVLESAPPLHTHRHKTTARTALLLILGSSPMIEGIPAFFTGGLLRYGLKY
jgi:hypothetical protein